MKVQDLKKYIGTLERIKESAGRLHYYAKFRRVTHTLRQLRYLINELALFKHQIDKSGDQLNLEFYRDLNRILRLSQMGNGEVRLDSEGLYIAGTFDPVTLSRYLLVAIPPPTIYIAKSEVENG
jgi:hypothetical protein